MNLDDRISQACEAVGAGQQSEDVPKSGFHVELEEALWLLFDGKSMAEIAGEVKRGILAVAERKTGGIRQARKALNISPTTYYRIKHGGNKY